MKGQKMILVAAAVMVCALAALVGCGGIDDPSNDTNGEYKTGNHLTISISGSLKEFIDANDGSTTSPLFNDEVASFIVRNSVAPGAAHGSDLYISDYTIRYTSSDPNAVPLPPLTIPVGLWVTSDGILTMTNWPYIIASTKAFFYFNATPGVQVVYTADITFHATNTFGYETEAEIGWPLVITDYL
jgi:hypothetical protein